MNDHTKILALMDDLRLDREELQMLRDFYETCIAVMNSAPPGDQGLVYSDGDPIRTLERIADAMPDRRAYLGLKSEPRKIILS